MSSDEDDITDIANEYWYNYTQQQIQRQRRDPCGFGTTHCVECGEEIDEGRRRAITTNLCLSCKEELEQIERRYNR